MINMELNEHTAEDAKMVQELRRQGLPDEVIQAAYNNAQAKRENQPNGDLISRSALLEMLHHNKALHTDENGETRQLIAIGVNRLIEYVEKMPTAFDVDKVVKRLESLQECTYTDGRPRFTWSEQKAIGIAITVLNNARQ